MKEGLSPLQESAQPPTETAVNPKKPNFHERPFGLAKGDFVTPNDFDAHLPEEILKTFEEGEDKYIL